MHHFINPPCHIEVSDIDVQAFTEIAIASVFVGLYMVYIKLWLLPDIVAMCIQYFVHAWENHFYN